MGDFPKPSLKFLLINRSNVCAEKNILGVDLKQNLYFKLKVKIKIFSEQSVRLFYYDVINWNFSLIFVQNLTSASHVFKPGSVVLHEITLLTNVICSPSHIQLNSNILNLGLM